MRQDPKKWKTLKRIDTLKHPRLHLVEDEVELPDGNITKYLRQAPVASHSVGIIAQNSDGNILLQREYSYPPDRVLWQLPGGSINENEQLEHAASRELSEESGLEAKSCTLLGSFYTNNRRSDEKQFIVLCTGLKERKQDGDPEEFIHSTWVSIESVRSMIKNGEIENINMLAALNLFFSTI